MDGPVTLMMQKTLLVKKDQAGNQDAKKMRMLMVVRVLARRRWRMVRVGVGVRWGGVGGGVGGGGGGWFWGWVGGEDGRGGRGGGWSCAGRRGVLESGRKQALGVKVVFWVAEKVRGAKARDSVI